MRKRAHYIQIIAVLSAFLGVGDALADPPSTRAATSFPNGAVVLRVLGPSARQALAASPNGPLGALVSIPAGLSAAALGVREVAPGIGALRGEPNDLLGFANLHPDVRMEVSPPLHLLMDSAGQWTHAILARKKYGLDGTGALVGVADTGIDITHPDFLDASGNTRVVWMLDLSQKPIGLHPDLEDLFGAKDSNGNVVAGAVYDSDDINALLKSKAKGPTDEVGHGTHVSSIAAGNGGGTPYIGIAPNAGIIVARITRAGSESIDNDDLVDGVNFLFNRGDALGKPIAVNLSIGGDFGSHDGLMLWEQALAANVGSGKPGHALVVAAGNSGSIVDTPIHESVRVSAGTTMRVPIVAAPTCVSDASGNTKCTATPLTGAVQVWVALRSGANLQIGIDGPDGTWISPIGENSSLGKNIGQANAGVIYGTGQPNSPIPSESRGAIALWSGTFPTGTYAITLKGDGTADLFMQSTGDAASRAYFAAGVREGTINLPATEPSLIGVGCSVNKVDWTSISKVPVSLRIPVLDAKGGYPAPGNQLRELTPGEMCWFSSAGPTVSGVPKPEITAPGGVVIGAMSAQAPPGVNTSIFTNPNCPTKNGVKDTKCMQVDAHDGVAVGTSMSAPMVAGAIALLFQRDPTLTQSQVSVLLQAGAHPFRGAAPFGDQSGPGELDVAGALDAYDQMQNPALALPSFSQSWETLSSDYASADGESAVTVILELRNGDGSHRADLFDISRLVPQIEIDGAPSSGVPSITRRGPGVYIYTYNAPVGSGGSSLTLGAAFDGAPIVTPHTIPISTDIWTGNYPSSAKGGCSISGEIRRGNGSDSRWLSVVFGALVLAFARRKKITVQPR
ncbi:MAG: S8 family serine peptidase [Polyangiaceae bacterium]